MGEEGKAVKAKKAIVAALASIQTGSPAKKAQKELLERPIEGYSALHNCKGAISSRRRPGMGQPPTACSAACSSATWSR